MMLEATLTTKDLPDARPRSSLNSMTAYRPMAFIAPRSVLIGWSDCTTSASFERHFFVLSNSYRVKHARALQCRRQTCVLAASCHSEPPHLESPLRWFGVVGRKNIRCNHGIVPSPRRLRYQFVSRPFFIEPGQVLPPFTIIASGASVGITL